MNLLILKNIVRLFAILALLVSLGVHAQTSSSDVQSKIDARNAEIQRLEEEIALYEKKLNAVSKEASTLEKSLKSLDLSKKKLTTDISVTETKVEQTNEQIASLSTEITEKQKLILQKQLALSELIQDLYERGDRTFTETILMDGSMSTLWQEVDAVVQLQGELDAHVDELRGTKQNLEADKLDAESIRKHLTALKAKLADQHKIAEASSRQKDQLLKKTKNEETEYKKLLLERQARKVALDAEIRAYEAQLPYDYNPTKLPREGSRPLSWPLDKVYITQRFGKTVAAKRLYASGSHSGVDFRASVGTPVMSMAAGVVMGVGDTDRVCDGASFGKWVYILYDNGLSSAYGHLSLTKVQEGQRVERGDVVAYSGNTGHTTGPHLHVTVYDGSAAGVKSRPSSACSGAVYTMPLAPVEAYLDPLAYLPQL